MIYASRSNDFSKKTQNFKLNNDFTSDISGQGNKLSLDNVEENDFCILRNADRLGNW